MTKEHFKEANQLYDYMTDIEDNLKRLDRINNSLNEDTTVFDVDTTVFVISCKLNKDAWKKILNLCIKCDGTGMRIPKGLESEVIKKIHECLSEEFKDCQVEFASL